MVDTIKVLSNTSLTKDQITKISNIFAYAKNMKELIELQVMLNKRYIEY
jgi:hypothetical protein